MKVIDPVKLFYFLLESSYDVTYLDLNTARCDKAEIILGMYGYKGQISNGKLSGYSLIHSEITIAVNPDQFGNSDWKNISPVNIPIYLPE